MGETVFVEGCPEPFQHPDLRGNMKNVAPLPKHDLYSLVVATAALLMPGIDSNAYHAIFQKFFRQPKIVTMMNVCRHCSRQGCVLLQYLI